MPTIILEPKSQCFFDEALNGLLKLELDVVQLTSSGYVLDVPYGAVIEVCLSGFYESSFKFHGCEESIYSNIYHWGGIDHFCEFFEIKDRDDILDFYDFSYKNEDPYHFFCTVQQLMDDKRKLEASMEVVGQVQSSSWMPPVLIHNVDEEITKINKQIRECLTVAKPAYSNPEAKETGIHKVNNFFGWRKPEKNGRKWIFGDPENLELSLKAVKDTMVMMRG